MPKVVGTYDVASDEIQCGVQSGFNNPRCSDRLGNHAGHRAWDGGSGKSQQYARKPAQPPCQCNFLLFSSAWIGPPEGNQAWMIPAAILALLVPFFFASYGTEYLVMKHMVGMPEGGNPKLAYPRVRIAVRNANLITYGAMFAASSVWLVILFRHR